MRKHGSRNKEHYKLYKAAQTRERNKLKRIVKSNGRKAATTYATKHNLIAWLNNNL